MNRDVVDWVDGLLLFGQVKVVQRITEPEQIRPVLMIRTLNNIRTYEKELYYININKPVLINPIFLFDTVLVMTIAKISIKNLKKRRKIYQ